MEKELEILVNSKQFDELSIQQKEYVLEIITEEEYTAFFTILLAARNTFEEDFAQMNPKEEVKMNLKQAFQNKHRKPSFFRLPAMDLSFHKPAFYKLAFILSAVIAVPFFLYRKPAQSTHLISKSTPAKRKQSSPTITPTPSIPYKKTLEVIQPSKVQLPKNQSETEPVAFIDTEDFILSTTLIVPLETTEFCSADLIEQNTAIELEDFLKYTTPVRMDDLNN